MTLGAKIKKARTEANLTQKGLADQLSVTFQTVSKWEGGITEPDLATLRAMAKILGVSLEYLVSEDEETPGPEQEKDETPAAAIEKRQIGTCPDCHSAILEGDSYHNVERKSPSGVKETVMVCDACFKKHEEEMERRVREVKESMVPGPVPKKGGIFHRITDRNDKKPLIWGIVIGIIALIVVLVFCIANYGSVGLGWTIAAPLLGAYALTATIYCIFTMSYISDVFMEVASWSIRFPGILFTLDLDGILNFIALKILFFVLGIFVGIGTFLLATALSMFLSIFSFIPLLVYNKTHY